MAIKFGAKSAKILRLGVGALTGSGLNYMVKAVNIPGMNTPIIPLTAGKSLNVDDVLELGVSGGILAYGYKKKNMTTKLVAGGMIAGVLANKALEFAGAGVIPIPRPVSAVYRMNMDVSQANLGRSQQLMSTYGVHLQTNKGRYTLG